MFYCYTLSYPDGRVFYVGKGTLYRMGRHEREAQGEGPYMNPYRVNVIKKIWREGGKVLKTKVAMFEIESQAFEYEKLLIAAYRFFGVSLTNMTGGGEGASGRPMAQEARDRLSAVTRARVDTEGPLSAKTFPGLIAPDGTIYKDIHNLRQFCRDKGIEYYPILHLFDKPKTYKYKKVPRQSAQYGWRKYTE